MRSKSRAKSKPAERRKRDRSVGISGASSAKRQAVQRVDQDIATNKKDMVKRLTEFIHSVIPQSIDPVLLISGLLHIGLIAFSEWQDRNMHVKYTDVDYHVFTDAARHVFSGGSPYDRHTYRYTPLLAWLLIPNLTLFSAFGKVLFSLFDLMVGYMIFRLTRSVPLACFWLFSPIALGVASRGSCDSIICALVLSLVFLVESNRMTEAALVFGFAVHFRLFPIVFALPILLKLWRSRAKVESRLKAMVSFSLISALVFLALLVLFYLIYGWKFVYETYLYHFLRKDHRHNFSVFFYPIYLLADSSLAPYLGIVTFLPQLIALVAVGSIRRPLAVIALLQTLVFVAFNKVITAQYFTWFLCLLPLAVPHMQSYTALVGWLIAWLGGQLFWLYNAYNLEIQGINAFRGVFVAGLLFFVTHVGLIVEIVKGTSSKNKSD